MSTNDADAEIGRLKSQLGAIQKQGDLFQEAIDTSRDESQQRIGVFDMDSWLTRRRVEYAEIRDVRGASILLSQSILQFLIPEKGIKLDSDNEMMGGITNSKCNKDIRIGVTAACKEFGMKITGRGSIAGCESSNLIDIPIICDVLQSVGLFEDSSFPNPSDRVDKAERKAAKKAASLEQSSSTSAADVKEVTQSGGVKGTTASAGSNGSGVANTSTDPTPNESSQSKSSEHSSQSKQTTDPSSSSSLDPVTSSSSSDSKSPLPTDDHTYAPSLIDIEAVLSRRWNHHLEHYLTDMLSRKTPYQYHAADGISSEGVAMVASYMPTSTPTPRNTPKVTVKSPRANSKVLESAPTTSPGVSSDEAAETDQKNDELTKKEQASKSGTVLKSDQLTKTDKQSKKDKSAKSEKPVKIEKTSTTETLSCIEKEKEIKKESGDNSSDSAGMSTRQSRGRKQSLDVVTDPESTKGTGKVKDRRSNSKTNNVDNKLDTPVETISGGASKKSQRKSHAAAAAAAATALQSPPLYTNKKNKAVRATKKLLHNVPFDVSATPRQTPGSATSASSVSRRPLEKFHESNGAGECLDLLETGEVNTPLAVVDKSKPSSDEDTNDVTDKVDKVTIPQEIKIESTETEQDDTCVNSSNSSTSSDVNDKSGEDDVESKEKDTTVIKVKTKKEKDKKSKKLKLKHIDTDLDSIGDDANSTDAKLSTSSTNKKAKRKDLLVVISPATGGPVATAPALPPRIGSGGVGGTTTGYTISPAILKPSSRRDSSSIGGGDNIATSEKLSGAQAMYVDPDKALQNWAQVCYAEGLVLAEEEKLLRQLAGMCELSLPDPAFRVGTSYLNPEYSYVEENNRYGKMMSALEEMEEKEYGSIQKASSLQKVESKEDARGTSSKRRRVSSGIVSGAPGRVKKERSWLDGDHSPRSRGSGGKSSRGDKEGHLMHSAVSLDGPAGSNYFDQFEGDEYEKVTDPNVSLTANMLWLRAQANAVHKPSTGTSKQSDSGDSKQRPKRDKKDFFDTLLSESGGQAIASAGTTTLAAVAGVKHIHNSDEDVTRVVTEQIDKIKKGNRNSAMKVTTLHPGALEALDKHGVSTVGSLPLGQPGGGFKRQRSLSNAQLNLAASSSSAALDTMRSPYLADTIGGYPTKNTVPPMTIQPSLYAPAATIQSSSKVNATVTAVSAKNKDSTSTSTDSIIHTCPFTNRISLEDLTVYSVKMPWKLLAREFEIFDPSAMNKDHSSFPRTPTSMGPSSPRYPIASSANVDAGSSGSGISNATADNLNGPMGVWVPTGPATNKPDTPSMGLRITAPPSSHTVPHVRRRRKRNSDGVLMDLDSSVTNSSPRMNHATEQITGPREFRRIAFSDVLAPSFRLVDSAADASMSSSLGTEEDEEDEDISDEAILKRHEATLTSMRDRLKAIQELKSSLKKSAHGDDDGTGGSSASNGNSSGYPMSNISHAHNKRRKHGPRPGTPKNGGLKKSTLAVTSPRTTPKPAAETDVTAATKVSTRRSKSPSTRSPDVTDGVSSTPAAPLAQPRKRGRPSKLQDA